MIFCRVLDCLTVSLPETRTLQFIYARLELSARALLAAVPRRRNLSERRCATPESSPQTKHRGRPPRALVLNRGVLSEQTPQARLSKAELWYSLDRASGRSPLSVRPSTTGMTVSGVPWYLRSKRMTVEGKHLGKS